MKKYLQKNTMKLLTLCLLLSQTALANNIQKIHIDKKKADVAIEKLTKLLINIDNSQFDIEALLEKLDYDKEEIIRFVSNKINFEDYSGLLRGAEGTLQSFSGNSLDQSFLLAKLLRNVDMEVRIVEGIVPHSDIKKLLLTPRYLNTSPLIKNLTPESNTIKYKDISHLLPNDIEPIATSLMQTIKDNNIKLGEKLKTHDEQLVPYFWVEYRDLHAKEWVSAHPSTGYESIQLINTTPIKYHSDNIDKNLLQRIKVQAFIERSRNGKLETIAITPEHEFPTANLSNLIFSYSVTPIESLLKSPKTIQEAQQHILKSKSFVPLFNFGNSQPNKAFDLNGNVIPIEEALSAVAPLFQEVGNKFGSSLNALSFDKIKNKTKIPTFHIKRHWITFTLIKPNNIQKTITRELSHSNNNENEFKKSLARTSQFKVATGAVSQALHLNKLINTQIEIIDSFSSTKPLEITNNFLVDAETFLLYSDIFSKNAQNTINYKAEPTILARYFPYGDVNSSLEGFDIITMSQHSISKLDGKIDILTMFKSGIINTWLEDKVFRGEYWQNSSAYNYLVEEIVTKSPSVLLSDSNHSLIKNYTNPLQDIIKSQISDNQLIIITNTNTPKAWWKIDPSSAQTLGMLSNGWGGSEFQEYLSNLTLVAGKTRVAVASVTCSLAISGMGIAVGIHLTKDVIAMAGGFKADPCSLFPPEYGEMCNYMMQLSQIAGQAGASLQHIDKKVLMGMCLKSIF